MLMSFSSSSFCLIHLRGVEIQRALRSETYKKLNTFVSVITNHVIWSNFKQLIVHTLWFAFLDATDEISDYSEDSAIVATDGN